MENATESAYAGQFPGNGKPQNRTIKSRGNRVLTVGRWLVVLVLLGAVLMIVRSLPVDRAMVSVSDWIFQMGVWGPVVLALVYAVATVLFVPGTILTLAAGAVFGLGVGTVAVSIGSTLGASLAFLVARYVARDKIAAIARQNRRFGAIDQAIGAEGWKIVALLRLSPAIPFNLQNYLYGLTGIGFRPYVLTSWLAMLPGTFLYVYLGHAGGAAIATDRSRTPGEWALLAAGLVATAVVTVYITRLARHKLKEQMGEEAQETFHAET
ncbi:MAG: TVP38/TMEM64 family protein [Pirellulales bacterium]